MMKTVGGWGVMGRKRHSAICWGVVVGRMTWGMLLAVYAVVEAVVAAAAAVGDMMVVEIREEFDDIKVLPIKNLPPGIIFYFIDVVERMFAVFGRPNECGVFGLDWLRGL